ncbi:MAG: (deoxy)nucleoside triphosphate pyrophosphohydrolase [Chitinispirillaceae bacterium]|jgi:8-oxo-dGTP diphosphatase
MPGPLPLSNAVPVACGIIERNDVFLAAQRGAGQSNAGLWEFPGGKIDRGETAETALVRELQEELGIEVAITAKLAPFSHAYPWIAIELIPFVCKIIKGEPHPCEHAEVRWINICNSDLLVWAPADIPVLREYLSCKTLSIT